MQNFNTVQKINYHKLMTTEIQAITNEFSLLNRKPTLLLHSCCAPCSTVCLERLIEFFDITVFFYNPNIDPEEEFLLRLNAQKKFLQSYKKMENVKLIVPENQRKDFIDAIDLQNFPERRYEKECQSRCISCYKFRLQKTFDYALKNDFDFWCTTLTLGPQKDAQKINSIADFIQNENKNAKVKFLHSDFKKQGGFLRSIELCKEFDIYRQEYCGCVFGRENQNRTT